MCGNADYTLNGLVLIGPSNPLPVRVRRLGQMSQMWWLYTHTYIITACECLSLKSSKFWAWGNSSHNFSPFENSRRAAHTKCVIRPIKISQLEKFKDVNTYLSTRYYSPILRGAGISCQGLASQVRLCEYWSRSALPAPSALPTARMIMQNLAAVRRKPPL